MTDDQTRENFIVSPIDYRYGRSELKSIFSRKERLRRMLLVEYAASMAEAEFGLVPTYVPEKIKEAIDQDLVKLAEVDAVEHEINHDVMAMVKVLSQKTGKAGAYVHFGLTSNDVNDTATALQLKDSFYNIYSSLLSLQDILSNIIRENTGTLIIGRTHGQHASPLTFGMKISVFQTELSRHINRLLEAQPRVLVGKLMGPVGTGASLGRDAFMIQKRCMELLGLGYDYVSTQIVGRDRYIEYLSIMNNISTTIERLATEIRNLQRPEISEVSERFRTQTQVGSSSMPAKQNPVDSESVCSLARLIRSMIIPEYEAGVYWHERDLTNSALERFVIPYSTILTDFIISRMGNIMANLEIRKEQMLYNLELDRSYMSESLVKLLVGKGMPRQDAHEMVRLCSIESRNTGRAISDVVMERAGGLSLNAEEISAALDPKNFTGSSSYLCSLALEEYGRLKSAVQERMGELKRNQVTGKI